MSERVAHRGGAQEKGGAKALSPHAGIMHHPVGRRGCRKSRKVTQWQVNPQSLF